MLQVRLLGQFDVRLDGRPVEIASRPAQALLACLCLTVGTPHRRETLAAHFWPDTTDANARSNLRHALWRLRSALDAHGDYLLADQHTVAFNAGAEYWLDTDILQQEFSGDWPTEEFIETVAVYGGELLPGFEGEWLDRERERLRGVFERQMQTLLDRLAAEGRWPDTTHWAERWLALGGAPEPAFRALMSAHAALGDTANLANVYQRCIAALRDELGVDPSPQTRSLYETLLRGEQTIISTQTAAASQPASTFIPDSTPRHNLPVQATIFVGREDLLAEIARLLANSECRLVTLTGPGGIGKTRLALQAASVHVGSPMPPDAGPKSGDFGIRFVDGVFFVPLAPVGSPDLIVPAIASAISFTFYGGQDSQDQLLNHLREKRMLLVLDNFEHLIEGAGVIAELLVKAPAVKCIATSRERLSLRGEWLISVEGLRVPEDGALDHAEYSAMQLFIHSARRVHAGFALPIDEVRHAARICRLVEGLPLAIELASAWVRAISLPEIAREIERNLDFLSTTMRDVPQRHRSLRAVFDHSWTLLSAEERRVFARLSVFRGGFLREAAEAVAEASLPVLSALMDKSLVRRQPSGRYEIHELLRQYARDKLNESNEAIQIRDRHLAHFLKLAEDAEPMLRRADQLEWLGRLDSEHDNLRVALKWATTDEQLEPALRLAASLALFWYFRGHWNEGRDWLGNLLTMSARAEAEGDVRAARARALRGAGWLANDSGDEVALYEQSLALSREIGDQWGEAYSLRGLGGATSLWLEHERVEGYLQASLALFQQLKDIWGCALVKYNLGWLALNREAHDAAMQYWTDSLTGFREVGDRWGKAVTVGALGYAARFDGDYQQAAALSKESLHLFRELGDKAGVSDSLSRLASVAFRRSDYAQAIEIYEESLAIAQSLGDQWDVAQIEGVLGLMAAYQGKFDRAFELTERAIRVGTELYGQDSVEFLLSYLATTAYLQGDLDRAQTVWNKIAGFARKHSDRLVLGYTINYLGWVALHRGDLAEAEALLNEGHELLRHAGDRRGFALALYSLGRLARAQGDLAQAESMLKQSLLMRKEMGDKLGMAEALEGLAGALAAHGNKDSATQAAKLFGTAGQLREKIGAPLPPVERSAYERDAIAARAQLGDKAFNAAFAAGRGTKVGEVTQ
ncbi:MAG TPA: tetratricopeptide repeat protein [Anaerolineales bacterium]|nr:tetratricopeptide repeat protein [Anaerolineales bacterium]